MLLWIDLTIIFLLINFPLSGSFFIPINIHVFATASLTCIFCSSCFHDNFLQFVTEIIV